MWQEDPSNHCKQVSWIALLSHVTLCILSCCDVGMTAAQADFSSRTPVDWGSAWHVECHRVCGHENIKAHRQLSCRHDVYKTKRGGDDMVDDFSSRDELSDSDGDWFLSEEQAVPFLQALTNRAVNKRALIRGSGTGIVDECCYNKGCTWEEFAETCHHYSRHRDHRSSMPEDYCLRPDF